jgi:hypothetical protein
MFEKEETRDKILNRRRRWRDGWEAPTAWDGGRARLSLFARRSFGAANEYLESGEARVSWRE